MITLFNFLLLVFLLHQNRRGSEILWLVLAAVIAILFVLLGLLLAGKLKGIGGSVVDLYD